MTDEQTIKRLLAQQEQEDYLTNTKQLQDALERIAALEAALAPMRAALLAYHRQCGHRNDAAGRRRWDDATAALFALSD